jgi:predicted DCC family thiol-disulfide oxidoreductase YuxK
MAHLMLFDGVCGMCQRSVQFTISRDRDNQFVFATLEGTLAQEVSMRHPSAPFDVQTAIVVTDFESPQEAVLTKSDAVFFVFSRLRFPWKLLAWLRVLPRPWRDAVYDAVARRRYGWFGKTETCELMTLDQRKRFIG